MRDDKTKTVLIVDDEAGIRQILTDRFADCNQDPNCPYQFKVDIAVSAAECVQRVRSNNYDVVVLDVQMEDERSGIVAALAIGEQAGREVAVKIIFTGFRPSIRECVEVMRYGVWDYITKEDVGETPAAKVVVESALVRLQQLDLQKEQESQIACDWLPAHLTKLQQDYGGQLVALWHRPKVKVIANGSDAFELETRLKEWRELRASWEQPFIVQIPPQDAGERRES